MSRLTVYSLRGDRDRKNGSRMSEDYAARHVLTA